MQRRTWCLLLITIFSLAAGGARGGPAAAQAGSRYFPQTGHTVQGRFLEYWDSHGGLAQQGYPLTEEVREVSPTDGNVYTVQYFERAVFEYHPENPVPYDVLLSLLGVFQYNQRYGSIPAPDQHANQDFPRVFTETGYTIGGSFREYWESHGALPQQGYPISDEFTEISALNGKPYTVQYFQRAVFEYHPENAPPYNVLLSQLGTFRLAGRGGGPLPTPPPPQATRTPGPQPVSDLAGKYAALISRDVVGTPVLLGPYLAYAARKPGGGVALYARDLEHSSAPVTLADPLGQRADIDIAGEVVVWLEPAAGGLWRFRSHDMAHPQATGSRFDTLPARAYGRFSARNNLVYEDTSADHKGLWMVDFSQGTPVESLVSRTGVSPVDGFMGLLWQEPVASGWELHLRQNNQPATDRVLATAALGFTGYDSQDAVVWAAQTGDPLPESAGRVQLYPLNPAPGGPQSEISTRASVHPMIRGQAVAWSENHGNLEGWALQVYNRTTRQIKPLLPVTTFGRLEVAGILDGYATAFTLSGPQGTDLYTVALPGDIPAP